MPFKNGMAIDWPMVMFKYLEDSFLDSSGGHRTVGTSQEEPE